MERCIRRVAPGGPARLYRAGPAHQLDGSLDALDRMHRQPSMAFFGALALGTTATLKPSLAASFSRS